MSQNTAPSQEARPQDNNLPEKEEFLRDVFAGLQETPKSLPCKYFYDAKGSQLFDQITTLEAYYPTRTELGILQQHLPQIADIIGPNAIIVEPGSGSSLKTHLLLKALYQPTAYIPVDISEEHLHIAAQSLRQQFPHIAISPIAADYTKPFSLPPFPNTTQRIIAYYPGSTLGNFPPTQAIHFLSRLREVVGASGGLLLGVDRKKDKAVLEHAYNDPEGVTAAFNLNLLVRINQELGADFKLEQFAHDAFYNEQEGRIEMHLRSKQEQIVHVQDHRFAFAKDETICTEYSYKYSPEEVQQLGQQAGFQQKCLWSDPQDYFSLYFFSAVTA
ncbi:MAG: L-histidine N(alpha)-methyltransferase [Myxococcales bacterium]|nr:L-histidine N(alpha)-methyltransferase [Myxococcales bacterium]MCB9641817.1 L-histidine N(alpha)-methyltransferase [Myxococcales bacterium]